MSSSMQKGKQIIRKLKDNRFEAYFVGGIVRDFIMKRPFSDIDITTNAKPFQVMKLFKTIPTGLKYGTVTILHDEEKFEITTYRIDGPSKDFRHPDSVIYSDNINDDVSRRDFTINGLIMDDSLKITDFVNGLSDINNKIIRTINNPYDRFQEDALRIIRALYFQAKLGFKIEENTKKAMEDQRNLLNQIAYERIYAELLKMLREPFVKDALMTMVDTKIHEVLPGLKEGCEYLYDKDVMPYTDNFFTLCFTLSGSVPKIWPFSTKTRHLYENAANLARKYKDGYDNVILYTYGYEQCLLAHKVNYFLGNTKYIENKIKQQYDDLPIKSELELKLPATEMIDVVNKKAGAWVSNLRHEMAIAILNGELTNTKDDLIKYIKEKGI